MSFRSPPWAAAALVLSVSVGAVPVHATPTPGPQVACPGGVGYRVGAAKADITPTVWPVAEAAYGIGRKSKGAKHPFFARVVAVQSCADATTIVLAALDSQGYFTAYKEDLSPSAGSAGLTDPTQGFGTTAIRAVVAKDTGVPVGNVLIAATHTHNSPDSVGVWGGGSSANNLAPYLGRVKTQTVHAIEAAIRNLRPAILYAGTADISRLEDTYAQVRSDPMHFPTDSALRVLHAIDAKTCAPIATLVNAGVHADVAGPVPDPGHPGFDFIDPDWPGRVATNLEKSFGGETAVVMPGAVGRTGPSFPSKPRTDPGGSDFVRVAAYGDLMTYRVRTALAMAKRVPNGPVAAIDAHLKEEIAQPALIPLFAAEPGVPGTLGGTMRSLLPPYTVGSILDAEVQSFRVGSLAFNGAPGEAYPEVATVSGQRVASQIPPFTFGLADDQLGYTPPAFEYPVVAVVDGGDEGFFTLNAHFGDDIINQHLSADRNLGLRVAAGTYDGVGAGPFLPAGQNSPAPDPANVAYPKSAVPFPSAGCAR